MHLLVEMNPCHICDVSIYGKCGRALSTDAGSHSSGVQVPLTPSVQSPLYTIAAETAAGPGAGNGSGARPEDSFEGWDKGRPKPQPARCLCLLLASILTSPRPDPLGNGKETPVISTSPLLCGPRRAARLSAPSLTCSGIDVLPPAAPTVTQAETGSAAGAGSDAPRTGRFSLCPPRPHPSPRCGRPSPYDSGGPRPQQQLLSDGKTEAALSHTDPTPRRAAPSFCTERREAQPVAYRGGIHPTRGDAIFLYGKEEGVARWPLHSADRKSETLTLNTREDE
ncbi:uncharacterized protein LOC143645274 [Tamandua tetradactyla]|uniref:uncharacterized protein LOC143645274 n=1 Tax=Tamandua tetradactyla TaxID=48850 RepID=UPI0040546FB1